MVLIEPSDFVSRRLFGVDSVVLVIVLYITSGDLRLFYL